VLIIDDEPQACRIIGRMLGDDGFAVLSAGTAKDGLAAALNHRVDLVLIDLLLPDGNGLDLARALGRARPEVPFVIVSGHLDTEVTVEAIKLGAADAIDKPVKQGVLCAKVRAALSRGRRHGPEWAELDQAASNADRWAMLMARTVAAERDPHTIPELTHADGVSPGVFCALCRLVGVKPHDARDLARLLRAMLRSGGDLARIPALLNVLDSRTLEILMERAGLAGTTMPVPRTAVEFLLRQRFVPVEHDALQALLRLMRASDGQD
jgi:FixJ family two-component response regulator